MRLLFIFLLFSLVAGANECPLQEGDILFIESTSGQAPFIQLATNSSWTHVGLIFKENGSLQVFEASARVRFSSLKKFLTSSRKNYSVKRIKGGLTTKQVQLLREISFTMEGTPYDILFTMNDEKIYCSELVWEAYQQALGVELGTLQKISSLNIKSEIIKKEVERRFNKKKTDEVFTDWFEGWKEGFSITPVSIFKDTKQLDEMVNLEKMPMAQLINNCSNFSVIQQTN